MNRIIAPDTPDRTRQPEMGWQNYDPSRANWCQQCSAGC